VNTFLIRPEPDVHQVRSESRLPALPTVGFRGCGRIRACASNDRKVPHSGQLTAAPASNRGLKASIAVILSREDHDGRLAIRVYRVLHWLLHIRHFRRNELDTINHNSPYYYIISYTYDIIPPHPTARKNSLPPNGIAVDPAASPPVSLRGAVQAPGHLMRGAARAGDRCEDGPGDRQDGKAVVQGIGQGSAPRRLHARFRALEG